MLWAKFNKKSYPARGRRDLPKTYASDMCTLRGLQLLLLLLSLSDRGTALCPFSRMVSDVSAVTAGSREAWVRLNGDWYDLGAFADERHTGGSEIIRRFTGEDITSLFFSNHLAGLEGKLKQLQRYRRYRHGTEDGTLSHVKPLPVSDLYTALKLEVKDALETAAPRRGGYRARFPVVPLLARYMVLGLAAEAATMTSDLGPLLHLSLSGLYGLMIGQAMWTHGHTAVHDPHAVSASKPWMGALLAFDLANVPQLWLREHHAHHAHTNSEADPDTRWFMPAIDYRLHALGAAEDRAAPLSWGGFL